MEPRKKKLLLMSASVCAGLVVISLVVTLPLVLRKRTDPPQKIIEDTTIPTAISPVNTSDSHPTGVSQDPMNVITNASNKPMTGLTSITTTTTTSSVTITSETTASTLPAKPQATGELTHPTTRTMDVIPTRTSSSIDVAHPSEATSRETETIYTDANETVTGEIRISTELIKASTEIIDESSKTTDLLDETVETSTESMPLIVSETTDID